MRRKGKSMPVKQTMNLYYKTDRTTKPATASLYILFILVVLLGLSKVLIYDLWIKVEEARASLSVVQLNLNEALAQSADYDMIKRDYQRYSATDEERAQVDRLEIIDLLDTEIGAVAQMNGYSISGTTIQLKIEQVTLAEMADIISRLEASPFVSRTTINTAATTSVVGDRALVSADVVIELVGGVGE